MRPHVVSMIPALLIFGLIAILTAGTLILPALRQHRERIVSRAESAEAVLREKMAQIERDQAMGMIDAADAEATRAEIGRSLIATAREAEEDRASGPLSAGGRGGIVAVAALSVAIGIGVYAATGHFNLPDQPLQARSDAAAVEQPTLMSEHEGSQMSDAIVRLREKLERAPDDPENWHFLARSYSAIGAFEEAAEAYARAVELAPFQIDIRGDFGEALVRAEQGFVGPNAVEQFDIVLTHAPEDPRALYYIALRDAQDGESMKAAEGWARILTNAPPDAPYRPAIRSILEAIIEDAGLDRAALRIPDAPQPPTTSAPRPGAADIAAAAAMPADEQFEMIQGMVDGLEARLADEPGDVEGWLRLARSRAVLGEPEAAVAALERALEANPGDPQLTAALAEIKGL